MHPTNDPPYISLRVLPLTAALLIRALFAKNGLIKDIISLPKKLSIVYCPASSTYYGVNESQNAILLGNQWVCGGLAFYLHGDAGDHEIASCAPQTLKPFL